ncbi:MAG TPA: response regulator [Gemmatimonas sp.]|nr:response regulator [Gemmatimonas sp.]
MTGEATRVLLVEDNELNRDMLSRRLVRRGFEVHIAVNGAEGLRMTRELHPDIVLLDMSLPVMDGMEVARQLKAQPSTQGIPLLALTAHAMTEDRERALAAGCDDFDTKPVDLTRLLDKMAALLHTESSSP